MMKFLGVRKIDKMPKARTRELNRVMKGLNERIDESVLRWFGHIERMENNRGAKMVYLGECI